VLAPPCFDDSLRCGVHGSFAKAYHKEEGVLSSLGKGPLLLRSGMAEKPGHVRLVLMNGHKVQGLVEHSHLLTMCGFLIVKVVCCAMFDSKHSWSPVLIGQLDATHIIYLALQGLCGYILVRCVFC
jgi:hypothetical protein